MELDYKKFYKPLVPSTFLKEMTQEQALYGLPDIMPQGLPYWRVAVFAPNTDIQTCAAIAYLDRNGRANLKELDAAEAICQSFSPIDISDINKDMYWTLSGEGRLSWAKHLLSIYLYPAMAGTSVFYCPDIQAGIDVLSTAKMRSFGVPAITADDTIGVELHKYMEYFDYTCAPLYNFLKEVL